jgi:hypothetical protein
MHNSTDDYLIQYFIYLRAYSTAQIQIIKQTLAKEIKKHTQTEHIKKIRTI